MDAHVLMCDWRVLEQNFKNQPFFFFGTTLHDPREWPHTHTHGSTFFYSGETRASCEDAVIGAVNGAGRLAKFVFFFVFLPVCLEKFFDESNKPPVTMIKCSTYFIKFSIILSSNLAFYYIKTCTSSFF